MSPKTGRPSLSDGEKKSLRLEIRLNKEEMEQIQGCAKKLGVSKAEALLKGIDLLSKELGI